MFKLNTWECGPLLTPQFLQCMDTCEWMSCYKENFGNLFKNPAEHL